MYILYHWDFDAIGDHSFRYFKNDLYYRKKIRAKDRQIEGRTSWRREMINGNTNS